MAVTQAIGRTAEVVNIVFIIKMLNVIRRKDMVVKMRVLHRVQMIQILRDNLDMALSAWDVDIQQMDIAAAMLSSAKERITELESVVNAQAERIALLELKQP